jgi:hypothetical protein
MLSALIILVMLYFRSIKNRPIMNGTLYNNVVDLRRLLQVVNESKAASSWKLLRLLSRSTATVYNTLNISVKQANRR